MYTPWGPSQETYPVIAGMVFVSTASHGGVKLDAARNRQMPEYLRRPGGWYEEDCEWCLPVIVFEAEILAGSNESFIKAIQEGAHRRTMANWFPDEYERHFGVTLAPGESCKKDEAAFYAEHAGDYLVVSAYGDWKEGVPAGYVGVCARIGGHGNPHGREKYFLVPAAEYDHKWKVSFVVDPARHREVTNLDLPATKQVTL
jgi:hypothetical protein